MDSIQRVMCLIVGLLATPVVGATNVIVAGLFPEKALVQIDGAALRTMSVGDSTADGVKLVSVTTDAASFDILGERVTLGIGTGRVRSYVSSVGVARLTSDAGGHFKTMGEVNGSPISFMVDTGATLVVLPASEAEKLGIDYRQGVRGVSNTAAGKVGFYRVKLSSIRVGDVTLHHVDGAVMDGEGPTEALLGMAFLSQTNVRLDGDTMTLTKR